MPSKKKTSGSTRTAADIRRRRANDTESFMRANAHLFDKQAKPKGGK